MASPAKRESANGVIGRTASPEEERMSFAREQILAVARAYHVEMVSRAKRAMEEIARLHNASYEVVLMQVRRVYESQHRRRLEDSTEGQAELMARELEEILENVKQRHWETHLAKMGYRAAL